MRFSSLRMSTGVDAQQHIVRDVVGLAQIVGIAGGHERQAHACWPARSLDVELRLWTSMPLF